jgi:hypothetical protein
MNGPVEVLPPAPLPDGGGKPPLGLPEGSVRSVLALIVTGTVCGMAAFRVPVPDRLWEVLLLTLGAYFVSRAAGPKSGGDPP